MPFRILLLLVVVCTGLVGCGGDAGAPGAVPTAVLPSAAPPAAAAAGSGAQHITVQHILIGFKGSVPGKPITRTKEEARTLAYSLLAKAQGSADFDQLVKDNTDDAPPGIYGMANTGVTPASGEFAREGMVPAFGNVGFTLQVGQIGIADYDPQTSPYGYHIIKRIK